MTAAPANPVRQPANESTGEDTLFINEFRVDGAGHLLTRIQVEEAVYPFLGPGRTNDDIEQARASLEKAYADAGFQTVAVQIPPQRVAAGVVHLQVMARRVGRLRVKGAKYSSPQKIKQAAPSMAEGRVIDFNEVPKDIVALNQLPDRQVTPSLRAGSTADQIDVDLEVKETSPLHASVELNNRNGPNTKPLRLNASVSDNNIGQSGGSAGLSYQVSPQDTSQVKVYSAYYLARFQGVDWLNVMLQGTKQDSNVSTLGDTAVAGRGDTVGLRLLFNLPAVGNFTESATAGVDYKHFNQTVNLGASSTSPAATIVTPITYYPFTANYTGVWQERTSSTEFNAGVTFHVRGLGSNTAQFDTNRYHADGSFIYFHGDLAHTQEMGRGFQWYGKLQGQLADQPLLSGEQYAGGGLGTVRGYREAEEVGDSGLFGSLELRSPPLLSHFRGARADWRVFLFADAGWLRVIEALPGQKNNFDFASYGIGSRWQLGDHFNGSINASVPLQKEGETETGRVRVIFQGALNY